MSAEFDGLSLAQLRHLITTGQASPVEIVGRALAKAQATQSSLNAFSQVYPCEPGWDLSPLIRSNDRPSAPPRRISIPQFDSHKMQALVFHPSCRSVMPVVAVRGTSCAGVVSCVTELTVP